LFTGESSSRGCEDESAVGEGSIPGRFGEYLEGFAHRIALPGRYPRYDLRYRGASLRKDARNEFTAGVGQFEPDETTVTRIGIAGKQAVPNEPIAHACRV
jgi:hypothetical protein